MAGSRGLIAGTELDVSAEERIGRGVQVISMALGCLLLRNGWTLRLETARPPLLVRGEEEFEPLALLGGLVEGCVSQVELRQTADRLGITGQSLAPASPAQT